jgi:flagellar protein FlaG
MDDNVLEIRPVGLGPWITLEYQNKQERRGVKRVAKVAEGVLESGTHGSDAQSGKPTPAVSPEQTRELVESVQSYLADLNTRLSFEVYDKTGELVVKVINRDTQEVIRQIPSEELLKLHDKLEELRGVLFNDKA